MLAIFLHEIHDQMMSLRFQVSLVVLLLFFVANGVVYSLKTERFAQETARIAADAEQRYADVERLSEATGRWYYVLAGASGVEFMAEGGLEWFADRVWVNPGTGNGAPVMGRVRTQNWWIRRFEIVDWALIVRLVVSFLCIVVAYDSVSGGLESGTLRLVLSNPLSRGRLLIGRYAAFATMLMVATAVGALVSLLILALEGVLEPDAEILGKALLFLAGTAVYVSLFLFLAMAVSALTRSSASSLVLLILLWAVVIVVVPQTSYLVASHLAKRSDDDFGAQWEFIEEFRAGLEREGLSPRGLERGRRDGYSVEREYARRMAEAEKEQEQIMRATYDRDLAQYQVARTVNLVSPGFAYQYSMEALLGTGLVRRQSFREQARRYRETLRQFLRGRDAADPHSPHILYFGEYMSQGELEPGDIPRFKEEPPPMSDAVAAATVPAVILLLEAGVAFFLALWAINRAEIAGG